MSFADAMTSARAHDVVLVRWPLGVFVICVDGEVVGTVDGEVSMPVVYDELTRIVRALGGDPTRMRVETRAAFQGRSPEELLADVEAAREALREAPLVELSEPLACDYHGATYESGCGACTQPVAYDLRDRNVPELPEAAAREGASYLATVVERDGRRKVVLGGHTTLEAVCMFMDQWAPAHGLMDIYGDPVRGFAGGYVEEAG